jgi:peptide/nickel transport system ATP-binding protein
MGEAILEVKNLSVEYRTDFETVNAINDISFSLGKGETIGIVGETGAGKTTTALTLLRLLPEQTGRITGGEVTYQEKRLLELPVNAMREVRGEQIAMIFQDPMTSLNPVMTVSDQIVEALKLHNKDNKSKKSIDERTDEVLSMVGIMPERKHDYPHQFSGGMKQRVMIAIALSCEPELLIADEPTTALDVTIQAQVLAMIRDLRERLGMAMIMISHDLGVIAQTCDKVAVMYAGELIETGTLEDIFTAKRHHPYTEGLFGSIPNLKEKTKRLKPIAGLMPDPTALPEGCYFSPRCPRKISLCEQSHPIDCKDGSHAIKCHLFNA